MIATARPSGHPLHPVYARLIEELGYPEVTVDSHDAFVLPEGDAVLFFSDEPTRVREALDLAVILPEIARSFPNRFRVGVLLAAAANRLALRYGVRRWPALVFVRSGEYVGSIEGLREWTEYVDDTRRLLAAPTGVPPELGFDRSLGCHPGATA